MRNSIPMHFRSQSPSPTATPPSNIPTIRLISATPTVVGNSSPSMSFGALPPHPVVAPFATSTLAPKGSDAPRKKLVLKKSKVGLLGGVGSTSSKGKGSNDFSDVVRRVGAGNTASTSRGGFEIYVDQDPDVDEIIVLKRKKSRLGLDGMKWGSGALSEVTNVAPAAPSKSGSINKAPVEHLKEKDTQKWWSIGRGRKESKKTKENKASKENAREASRTRSKTPEPSKPLENRSRFNSLGSTALFSSGGKQGTVSSVQTVLTSPTGTVVPTLTEASLPGPPPAVGNSGSSGSIAVRAIRSMRSLARVKSWATIAGASSDKEGSNVMSQGTITGTISKGTISKGKTIKEKKKKRERKEKEEEDRDKTIRRQSGSSFEAGSLSDHPSPVHSQTLGPSTEKIHKKQSILGLGLPSSLRLGGGTIRKPSNASTNSSISPPPSILNTHVRLSADSAHLVMGANGRPSSTISSGSSLRPSSSASGSGVSTFSGRSPRSSSSSVVSIKWDEQGIRQAKDIQRKERRSRREVQSKDGKSTRSRSEGRQHRLISDIFPEVQTSNSRSVSPSSAAATPEEPIVGVEEAPNDGHENVDEPTIEEGDSIASVTPMKKPRARPISDQVTGGTKPHGIHDEASDGVLSILDAATNDLASLINRLDLEATPASSNASPLLRQKPLLQGASPAYAILPTEDTPVKRRAHESALIAELRESVASISSLRPYARAQAAQAIRAETVRATTRSAPSGPIGQNIAPWSSLDWKVSPRKPAQKVVRPKFIAHKRSTTPLPAGEPPVVFQPLCPARAKASPLVTSASLSSDPTSYLSANVEPSSRTFGSDKPSKIGVDPLPTMDEDTTPVPSPTPKVKRSNLQIRGSVFSVMGRNRISTSSQSTSTSRDSRISLETRKSLGMSGTLGGSTEPTVNPEDPDSDIPDELQVILSGQSDEESTQAFDDKLSLHHSSASSSPLPVPDLPLPPIQASVRPPSLPVFRATLIDDAGDLGDIDEGSGSEEDETKKSFDFTGELRKLCQSGVSHRRSFVEQLENAFRTPANIDLNFDTDFLKTVVPSLPALPLHSRPLSSDDAAPENDPACGFSATMDEESIRDSPDRNSGDEEDTLERLMAECNEDLCISYPELNRSIGSMRSKESDGQLNTSFKFGGRPSIPPPVEEVEEKPLTLSDILPPPGHFGSSSSTINLLEDSSILKSIKAKASTLASPRPRVQSDASLKVLEGDMSRLSQASSNSRRSSGASFNGFESFEEVRRGFEFANRAAFYPPPGATRPADNRWSSVYSIASVSSYGAVVDPGIPDPFGFASSRPTSEDFSLTMSTTVDDTFAYRRNNRRSRVDSNASNSSFYFPVNGRRGGHRRNESNMSTVSNAPPVSIYTRSFGAHHRRSDSSTSNVSSHARLSWGKYRPDISDESLSSDFSASRMARPGLGDRMFDMDYGVPLAAITASPPESNSGDMSRDRMDFDSITDDDRRYSITADSIFNRSDYRSSVMSEESVFGFNESDANQGFYFNPAQQFRPVSIISCRSVNGEPQDDTMVTMIGGGRAPLRRRSVESLMDASPLYRAEVGRKDKKRQALDKVGRVLKFELEPHDDEMFSPADTVSSGRAMLQPKPSIASTSSQQFGDERMIMAKKGLLERQSLEGSALLAQGEDLLASLRNQKVFSRPAPASHSRSSTMTSGSSGDTPPLSACDGSSVSGDSQSSIDISHLNSLLTSYEQSMNGIVRPRVRARPRGNGHRRRISQARISRSSVYETIQEETYVFTNSAASTPAASTTNVTKGLSPVQDDPVYIVDSETSSVAGSVDWTDDKGIVGMRQCYALKGEADETVAESKRTWLDTPFSIFAVQTFQPPSDCISMKAMLEHSQMSYGPLPSELRPHRVRSRTSSRPSPYPARTIKSTISPEPKRSAIFLEDSHHEFNLGKPFAAPPPPVLAMKPLQEVAINHNLPFLATDPALTLKPFVPLSCNVVGVDPVDEKVPKTNKLGLPARPRVTSGTRKNALGLTKRSTGKSSSNSQKENVSQGANTTSGDTLRINRPRPRGRPTPARTSTIRV